MNTASRPSVVGVFEDRLQAQRALEELRRAGFDESQLGVVSRGMIDASGKPVDSVTAAGEGAVAGALTGAGFGGLWGIGVAVGLLPVLGPVIAGGVLGSILASAAGAAAVGGIVGALIGMGIPEDEAQFYEGEVHSGRTIVSITAPPRQNEALAILRLYGAYDVETKRPVEHHT